MKNSAIIELWGNRQFIGALSERWLVGINDVGVDAAMGSSIYWRSLWLHHYSKNMRAQAIFLFKLSITCWASYRSSFNIRLDLLLPLRYKQMSWLLTLSGQRKISWAKLDYCVNNRGIYPSTLICLSPNGIFARYLYMVTSWGYMLPGGWRRNMWYGSMKRRL
mgnify:CR=1 FL=1